MPTPWPKLSESLPAERAPHTCQACGSSVSDVPRAPKAWETRQIWRECDREDQPTRVLVVLCVRCSTRIIEPHPRLYAAVDRYSPVPGAMALCVSCVHRDGVDCRHPDLKANGGEGLAVSLPPTSEAFFDGVRGGRRTGWRGTIFTGPPTHCAGQQLRSETAAEASE